MNGKLSLEGKNYEVMKDTAVLLVQYKFYRHDGIVVRVYAAQSVDLRFISQVESYQKTSKNGIYSFLAWRSANRDSMENKPASLLVVSLGKTLNGMPPSLCGRQMMGPSSLPVAVAPVSQKTCKPSVSANAVWPIYTSSCIKLTTNSSNDEEEV